MDIVLFKRMLEIEEEKDMDKLDVGDIFLYGRSVIAQKANKEIGESISYYKVIAKTVNGVEYTPIFDYMEGTKGEKEDGN